MDKNNLDEFFREKFKDFGEVPDESVWEALESSLSQKRKKRIIIPLWWKLGGVAALLAVLLYIANPFGDSTLPAVVNSENINSENPGRKQETPPENSIVNGVEQENVIEQFPQVSPSVNAAVNNIEKANNAEISSVNRQSEASARANERKLDLTNTATSKSTNSLAASLPVSKSGNDSEEVTKRKQDEILFNPKEAEQLSNIENKEVQKNIPEGIEAKEEETTEELTGIADKVEKKSIFDEIAQEEEITANAGENKWSVGPSVAPVYFSSFGDGSPIHSNFISNSKTGNLYLSYGLSVSYAISEKLSVRSGLHKVDYGYDTNDVQFSSSLAASTNNRIDNIDYALTSKNLVVQSNASGGSAQEDASLALSNEIAAPSATRDGRMVQQFGYLEIPVELNYTLIDRKLGVNIIGGVSSLFLVNNTVNLESEGQATEIGAANNINNLNFSTNIGFGFNYEVSSKVQLNLEPMFKYQLNTFSDTSGRFQPFSLGVYSGLNFKF